MPGSRCSGGAFCSTLVPQAAAGRGARRWAAAWFGSGATLRPPAPSPPRRAPLTRAAAAPRPPGRHERRSGRSAPRVSARWRSAGRGRTEGGKGRGRGRPTQTEDNFLGKLREEGRGVRGCGRGDPAPRSGVSPQVIPPREECAAGTPLRRRREAQGCCELVSSAFCTQGWLPGHLAASPVPLPMGTSEAFQSSLGFNIAGAKGAKRSQTPLLFHTLKLCFICHL